VQKCYVARLHNEYFNREITVNIQRVSYNASPSELYSTEDYYLTWKRQRQETLLQYLFYYNKFNMLL